jgi:hypothetical protein
MTMLDVLSGIVMVALAVGVVAVVGPGLLALLRGASVPKALKESRRARMDLTAGILGLAIPFVADVGGAIAGVASFIGANPFGVLATGPILGGLAIEGVVPISGGEFVGVGLFVVGAIAVLAEVYGN